MKAKAKNNWQLWWRYMGDQKIILVTTVLVLLLFAALTYIYALPWEPILYGSLLTGFFLVAGLLWNWRSWRKRHRLLTLLLKEVEGSYRHLPQSKTFIEQDYQTLLAFMGKSYEAMMGDQFTQHNENIEYFTLWAHQIKTPIAAMKLLIQSEKTPLQKEMLEELQRTEQYVEMVLIYTKLTGQSGDYVIHQSALDPIIKQSIRRYSSLFIRKKIALHYTPTTLKTITDEKWLQFVIEQVLSNSLKYTPEKGEITLWVDEEQNLWIADGGIGIPAEDLPRVFEKGYTGFHGRADKRATGIGLYLCKRICEKLGHSICITSALGEGTRVKIGLANNLIEVE